MIDLMIKIWAFFVGLIPHWTIVVDTETTRLVDGEILQVSLITGTGRTLLNRFIKPDYAIKWSDAQRINHISPKMVKHCHHMSSYVPLINAYLRHTKTLIGYNISRFDLPLLERYGVHTNAQIVDVMLEDSKRRTKRGERDARWRKLKKVAFKYGYLFSAHDSLEDCLATLHINVLMHPGIRTVLYFLRKIVRILVGVILIKFFQTGISNVFAVEIVGFPYLVLACWCYVYGPFTGIITALISVFFSTGMIGSYVTAAIFAASLGILYGITKSPKTWLLRIIYCIASTIIGGILSFIVLPNIAGSYFGIPTLDNHSITVILTTLLAGIPLYFLLNRYLKRLL